DKTGRVIVEPEYDEILGGVSPKGSFAVLKDGKIGIIGSDGSVLMEPSLNAVRNVFGDVCWSGFAPNGLAAFPSKGEYLSAGNDFGYVDENGSIVIEPRFDDARPFTWVGLAAVQKDGKWGFINEKGEYVIEPQYDDTTGFYADGYAGVSLGGLWTVIDLKGEMLFEPKYGEIGEPIIRAPQPGDRR
ncbi:MAG: WG repeat-containing protein, partial [Clostridia bacterium]|nr:WG repeat-containing protein [Clostridia bacterium]